LIKGKTKKLIYKAKIIAFNEETSYLILTIKNPGEEIEIYELK